MFNQSYTYGDIGLIPRSPSHVKSRKTVDTSVYFLEERLDLPILAAPMRSIVDQKFATVLNENKGLAFFPRVLFRKTQEETYKKYEELIESNNYAIPCIGITNLKENDYMEAAYRYILLDANHICIDVANGFHETVRKAGLQIKSKWPSVNLITGNVSSGEGYTYCSDFSDAVRVGISGGHVCTTGLATGVRRGQVSTINEVAVTKEYNRQVKTLTGKLPLIIADGGINHPGDILKALAIGADIVMSGSMFAGCPEAATQEYFGEASEKAKGHNNYIEGGHVYPGKKNSIESILERYKDGLQSGMSYLDCTKISDIKSSEYSIEVLSLRSEQEGKLCEV